MTVFLVLAISVFGLLIGSFLNVVIWRVPRGESLLPDSRCPHCGHSIRPWQNVPVVSWLVLRGRCAHCKNRISARYPLIECLTAVVFAGVTVWRIQLTGAEVYFGGVGTAETLSAWFALAAYLWFFAAAVALTVIDLEVQRLPDAIVLTSLLVVLVMLSVSSVLVGDWNGLVRTWVAAAVLFCGYFLIVLVYPAGMGGGDVKLAPLVGAALGFVGWGSVVVGGFAAFVCGALVGIALIAMKRIQRENGIPFGPFMCIGSVVGLLFGEQLLGFYLQVVGW